MMLDEWLPVFEKCELFTGISAAKLQTMLPCFAASLRSCQKGDVLKLTGQPQNSIGLVLEGEIHVQQEDHAGNRLIVGIFSPGELFGEVSAFSGLAQWPNTVLANRKSHVLFIPIEKISEPCCRSCEAHQILIRNMLMIVASKALIMNQRIGYLKLKGMREKLATYLFDLYRQQESTGLTLPMNRENLADYLNVSRSSMSRELGRMRDEGLIDFHRARLVIKDLKALRHLNAIMGKEA